MIKNIIWDIDGTLVDSYPPMLAALQAACRDLGFDPPFQRVRELALDSMEACYSGLAQEYRVDRARLKQQFESRYDYTRLADHPLFPGVSEICQYITARGGKNVVVTHRGRSAARTLVEGNGLGPYFAGYVTRDDGYPRKPDPAAFTAALTDYNLERPVTISVGDRLIDIQASRAAGIFSCYFGQNGLQIEADLVFLDYQELDQHLRRANASS